MEDTLNNSNDLFLTFRREMEEMSKKTKRLEKENQHLTRRHNATSENILQMAEERQRAARDLDALRRKNENLERLCRGMQAQGRSVAAASPASSTQRPSAAPPVKHALPNGGPSELDLDPTLLEEAGTESSYEYDDEDDSDGESDPADPARDALQTLESSPADADPGPAEGDDGDAESPSVLQVAAGAADLRSAVAATKAQRAQWQRAGLNGQPGTTHRTKQVNGQRRAG